MIDKRPDSPPPQRGGRDPGGTPYMKGVGMLVVSLRGVNFRFWSRLGCFGQNTLIFSRKGLFKDCTRRNIKKLYFFNSFYLLDSCNQSLKWSLLGVKKVEPRPNWSPLGVQFKISDEHPHPFHMRSPHPGAVTGLRVYPLLSFFLTFSIQPQFPLDSTVIPLNSRCY